MKIKEIGINASYFYSDSLLISVRRLAKLGFQKVEFSGLPLKKLSHSKFNELKKFLEEENLNCISINAVGDLIPVNLGNLAALQERERNNAIDHVKRCIDFAITLKSKRVICDLGTSTEDLLSLDKQNETFLSSLPGILKYAASFKVLIVLMNVPGRRWIAWDGLPPDQARVVERHVWPWRLWPDEEELLDKIGKKLKNQVSWAFDSANEVIANGITEFRLQNAVIPYLNYGLEIVYLANHPGPYNKAWHRLLLHQPLWNGFYTRRDYKDLLYLLAKRGFSGEMILQIREKEPAENSLQRSLKLLEDSKNRR